MSLKSEVVRILSDRINANWMNEKHEARAALLEVREVVLVLKDEQPPAAFPQRFGSVSEIAASEQMTGGWLTRCCACGKEYDNGVGSTECCGALQAIIAEFDERVLGPDELVREGDPLVWSDGERSRAHVNDDGQTASDLIQKWEGIVSVIRRTPKRNLSDEVEAFS